MNGGGNARNGSGLEEECTDGTTNPIRRVLTGRRVEPFWKHCALALPVALLPAAALVATASLVANIVLDDVSAYMPPEATISVIGVLGSVVFAPVVETFVMAVTLPILHAIGRRFVVAAVLSGLLWGFLHALIAPLWFVGPAWAFFVLSASYLAWREVSFWHAFAVACIPHALNNGLVLLVAYVFTR